MSYQRSSRALDDRVVAQRLLHLEELLRREDWPPDWLRILREAARRVQLKGRPRTGRDQVRIELAPGEQLEATFRDSDGVLKVSFDHRGDKELRVEADLPDSTGREGVIYRECFGDEAEDVALKWPREPRAKKAKKAKKAKP